MTLVDDTTMAEAPATTSVEVSAASEFPAYRANAEHSTYLLVHIKAPDSSTSSKRAPIRVSAVLDRSGSMSGAKLDLCKQSMAFAVRQLKHLDKLGVITYDDSVDVCFALKDMSAANKADALAAVKNITDGGCTNLAGGLVAGIRQTAGLVPVEGGSSRSRRTSRGPMQQQARFQTNACPPVPSRPAAAVPAMGPPDADGMHRMRLLIGNDYAHDAGNVITRMVSAVTKTKNEHKWTMFVRKAEGGSPFPFVKRVQYGLHPSFQPSTVSIDGTPGSEFEITRRGWGTFEVNVTVTLHDGSERKFTHNLTFDGNGAAAEHAVEFAGALPAQTASPVPTPAPAAPSAPDAAAAAAEEPAPCPPAEGEVVSCMLFTDGLANVGAQSKEAIIEEMRAALQLSPSCSVFTFGYGADHNPDMMKGIADAGRGVYYYVSQESEIPPAFADCLGGLVSVCAQGLALSVTGLNGARVEEVVTAYPQTRDGAAAVVSIPDLYSEEERDVLVRVTLPALANPVDEIGALRLTLSYKNLLTGAADACDVTATVRRPSETPPDMLRAAAVDRQVNRVETIRALEKGKELGKSGKLDEARTVLGAAIAAIEASPTAGEEFCRGLTADLRDCLGDMRDQAQYEAVGHKKMNMWAGSHAQQRSAGGVQAKYQNKSKAAYAAASSAPMGGDSD